EQIDAEARLAPQRDVGGGSEQRPRDRAVQREVEGGRNRALFDDQEALVAIGQRHGISSTLCAARARHPTSGSQRFATGNLRACLRPTPRAPSPTSSARRSSTST